MSPPEPALAAGGRRTRVQTGTLAGKLPHRGVVGRRDRDAAPHQVHRRRQKLVDDSTAATTGSGYPLLARPEAGGPRPERFRDRGRDAVRPNPVDGRRQEEAGDERHRDAELRLAGHGCYRNEEGNRAAAIIPALVREEGTARRR